MCYTMRAIDGIDEFFMRCNMNKNTFTKIGLNKGEVNVYNFGTIKLHAYKTNDLMSDEVFIVEKNGQSVVIESPCFFDNEKEFSDYVKDLNVVGVLVSYHAAGGSFLANVKKYGTKSAKNYAESGGGKALIDNFTKAFGDTFDNKLHKITEILNSGEVIIGGIRFVIVPNDEAYTIQIPEINAVYMHMLGHDCHSIVAGKNHADAIIAELNEYINKDFCFILTSHYTPEDLKDAQTKITYLQNLKKLASECENANQFKVSVKECYPNYDGENYLDMTANMFFGS